METANRRTSPSVADRLCSEPYRFDFFQAVRILDLLFLDRGGRDAQEARHPVGYDTDPLREIVRFKALQSLSFPSGTVDKLKWPDAQEGRTAQPEMTVSFMGLTGPLGVLPNHYTLLLIEALREGESALRDFFDLFNHRLISLFFRAWEKYRLPSMYERSRLRGTLDLFSECLYCAVGYGTEGLRGRAGFDDEAILYYAGFFADNHRPGVALEHLLTEYFGVPVELHQFQGQWLRLAEEDRSVIGAAACRNNQLGMSAVVGERIYDVQSKFRLRVGPLTYEQYLWMTPTREGLKSLWHLVRTFVGPEFDFEVQPVLKAREASPCQLGSEQGDQPLLGRTTWLLCETLEEEFDEASFTQAAQANP